MGEVKIHYFTHIYFNLNAWRCIRMIKFTPRYLADKEELAERRLRENLLKKIDLMRSQLEEMTIRLETAEKIANVLHNTENLKKQLLVLMESCVESGEYFKWRLYKLYTLRTKTVYDQNMIQQCERYLNIKYDEWKWLYGAYMDLIAADNSPSEITMKQFWR